MATIEQVRDGFKALVANADANLHVYNRWPSKILYPAAIVRPTRLHERLSMGARSGGLSRSLYEIVLLIGTIEGGGGIEKMLERLDEYADETGGKSIIAAIEADRTIGGTCETSNVLYWDFSGGGAVDIENRDTVGAKLLIEVWPL